MERYDLQQVADQRYDCIFAFSNNCSYFFFRGRVVRLHDPILADVYVFYNGKVQRIFMSEQLQIPLSLQPW